MKLTLEQQRKVEENMGLVGKVIHDKVHCDAQMYIHSREDLFQIGCIGLCKAAATDNGKCEFSTYAYRLIWNEICDQLLYASKRYGKEKICDDVRLYRHADHNQSNSELQLDVRAALKAAKKRATPTIAKGIDALFLMRTGMKAREIGEHFGVTANNVTAWISKAKTFLRSQPEFIRLTI